jgi:hypothetical protein
MSADWTDWTTGGMSRKERERLHQILAPLREFMGAEAAHMNDEQLAKAYMAVIEEHTRTEER